MAHITTLTRAYNDLHNSQANTYSYSGSFETFKESEVRVTKNDSNVITTLTYNSSPSDNTQYSVNLTDKTIHVGGGNLTSGTLSIFPVTDLGDPTLKAPYTAGSAITASDITNNQLQVMRRQMEFDEKKLDNNGDTMTGDLTLGEDVKIIFEGATDNAHETTLTVTDPTADRTITLPNVTGTVVTTGDTGTVATAMIADDAVDNDKLANSIVSAIAANTSKVTNATHTGEVTGATALTIADGAVVTARINDAAVTTAKLAADSVTGAKIADDAINSEHYTDGSIDTAHIGDSQVTTAKIAADAITNAKIADDAIDSEHYTDGSIDTAHIGGSQVTDAKLASNSVTTSKITDANVTAVKIADANITLAKLVSDLKQTTISDSDTQLPTSGAVVDYVAAQLEPFGGFEAIANEVSFPNTQPASGVAISIADAAGIVVNSSGVSTTGRTVGGSTVTINGINSQFNSSTIATGIRFIVTSTGSGQVYNYHKATLPESDLVSLSGDINDFNERYRVGSSNPSTALDSGDLFFNTSTGKLLVYNGTNSAWEEAQSIGNFFISTLSESFDGSRQDFTLSNAPTNAQQVLLIINGVVQKPNAGTSTPSEGFALSGSTVKLGAAPATGSTYHAVVMGSTVNIGTPSDGTVDTAKLTSGAVTTVKIADDAVTTAKITDANVTTAKITDANVTTAKIADDAVTAAKIAANAVGTGEIASGAVTGAELASASVTAAKIGANEVTTAKIPDDAVTQAKIADDAVGADQLASDSVVSASIVDGSIVNADINASAAIARTKLANVDVVDDTSPQLGGDLDTNSFEISLDDNHAVKFGAGNDLKIQSDGSNALLLSDLLYVNNSANNENLAKFVNNGAVELFYDNVKKIETTSAGVTVTGSVTDSKGNVRSIPRLDKSSAHTLAATDAGKVVYISTGGVTINESIMSAGDAVTIINNSGSNQTITQGTNVNLHNTADATTGNRTLAGRGMATVWFASDGDAYISGSGLS